MKDKICLFAGTTEGRFLAEQLKDAADLTVCVATEYGEVLLDNIEGIHVHTGRLDKDEMTVFFKENGFCRVIDATHPYAQVITENISSAAAECCIPVMRILRDTEQDASDAVFVSDAAEAAEYLAGKEGSILLTTGAKDLPAYKNLDMDRVWARVLPLSTSLDACADAGILSSHIIAAQGPFTYDINLAQMKMIGASYMVTKASGRNGGFDEKIAAARDAGAVPVIIGLPPQGSGLTMDQAVKELSAAYPLKKRKIYLIGIGPGAKGLMTADARAAVQECDALIGAKSVVSTLESGKPEYYEYLPDKVLDVLNSHPAIRSAAILMRGDIGFYSGAKKMLEALKDEDVTVVPGISSVVLFASRLGTSWDDACLASMHGRTCNIIHAVTHNHKTFALTGGENGPDKILEKLCTYGLGGLNIAIGENLSLANEKITRGTPETLKGSSFDPLSIIYIENDNLQTGATYGIADDQFIRGDVPMTKSEIRAVSMSKLSLSPDSTVWDVGAGTGSVSIECALSAYDGMVYAVEKEADAVGLIRQNIIKFMADNLTVIEGSAPEALEALPAPTHVFIGGSSGNLDKIIKLILSKNADARIVVNAVTLETQLEAAECAEKFKFKEFEAVSANISRSRKAGRYHLMTSLNPIWIYTMQGGTIVD
ncbi:MAG: precorrin-6A reductase [Lachnospiraceae bacterium]|nr:precorrin-6A reductase [Lachnospiraceae bacterium]